MRLLKLPFRTEYNFADIFPGGEKAMEGMHMGAFSFKDLFAAWQIDDGTVEIHYLGDTSDEPKIRVVPLANCWLVQPSTEKWESF